MKLSRHQRIRNRISIFTIVALLWSQFALAGHPAASTAFAALDAGTSISLQHGCQHPTTSDDAGAVCISHCSQGDQSLDASRIPPVPSALPPPVYSIALISAPVDSTAIYRATPLVVSWHRPTMHPASILLI